MERAGLRERASGVSCHFRNEEIANQAVQRMRLRRIADLCVVSVNIKRKTIALPAAAILVLAGLCAWFWSYRKSMPFTRPGVAHQLPYKWDSYVRPDVQFTLEPMSSVIAKVNAVIREVSSNAVPEAIKLD